MQAPAHSFTRLVLGLQTSRDEHALRFGVEFANLLHLDLLGLFVEDVNLRQLARFPFARELRTLEGDWRPLQLDRLSNELDLATRRAERLFADAAKALTGKYRFEVVRGAVSEAISLVSRANDIVMIPEPVNLAERATLEPSSFHQAALGSAASVMFAPPHPLRNRGAIAVIARSDDETTIETAAAIAATSAEKLIILRVGDETPPSHIPTTPAATELRGRTLTIDRAALGNPHAVAHALEGMHERIVVAPRGLISDDTARSTASLRRLPVLLVKQA